MNRIKIQNKEKQIEKISRFSDELLDAWIQSLLLDCRKTREEFEKESLETIKRLEEYELKETQKEIEYLRQEEEGRGYGPGNPWDAPGMSIQDFI